MKKKIFTVLALSFSVFAWAEYSMLIHQSSGKTSIEDCDSVDSLKCGKSSAKVYTSDGDISEIPFASLDSITFMDEEDLIPKDTVFITYGGNSVKCVNPYESAVSIETNGACVNVNSKAYYKDLVYVLSGSSSDGYFAIDSERKFKVIMNNLTLTSQKELSPIRSFSGKAMSIELKGKNTLTDSANDTCNAVLRSKGQIIFSKSSGSLTVNAKQKRAIQSGDYIVIEGGTINTYSELGDCVRANDYFFMKNGSLSLNGGGLNVTNGYFIIDGGKLNAVSSLDGVKIIDVETEFVDEEGDTIADSKHGACYITGGDLTFELSGEGARFIKIDGDFSMMGGSMEGTLSGPSFYESGDGVTNSSIIKAKGSVSILRGVCHLTASSKAIGARIIGSDADVIIDGGAELVLKNEAPIFSYVTGTDKAKTKASSAIKADGKVALNTCDVTIVCSAAEDGAYGIVSDGNVEVNEGAVVTIDCLSNDGIFIDEEMNGKLVSNGGFLAAHSETGYGISAPISSKGGVYVSLGKYKHNLGFSGSTYGTFMDLSYDGTPFQVTDAEGTVIFSHKGGFSSAKATKLSMSFSNVRGDTYYYKVGGTLSGETEGSSSFVLDGTYSGGEEFEADAPRATSSINFR